VEFDFSTIVSVLFLLAVGFVLFRELQRWRKTLEFPPFQVFLLGINQLYCRLWCHLSCKQPAVFPDDGGAIVISNHVSSVDPMVLQCGSSRILSYFIAKEYHEVVGLGWLYKQNGCIPVNRTGKDMAAIRAGIRHLRKGGVIAIFPEGQINKNGYGLLPGRAGTALLALRSRVPIVPAVVVGAPKGDSLVKPIITPSRITVKYGEPLDLTPYYDTSGNRDTLQKVTDIMMSEIAKLGDSLGADMSPVTHQETGKTPAKAVS